VACSGVLYVVLHGNSEKSSLCRVLEPSLRSLGPDDWHMFEANLLWTARKPIWFQVRGT
jgi:hypothetical protein